VKAAWRKAEVNRVSRVDACLTTEEIRVLEDATAFRLLIRRIGVIYADNQWLPRLGCASARLGACVASARATPSMLVRAR
jgi:hypothetical protein